MCRMIVAVFVASLALVPTVASTVAAQEGFADATPVADAGATTVPQPAAEATTDLRTTRTLNEGWRFVQDDDLTDDEALAASGDDWETVDLPHTWNAEDAASLEASGY
jgi:beta-galactosidase